MSFSFPHLLRSSRQPEAPTTPEIRIFDLPQLDKKSEVKVLPYDYAAGELAKRALLFSGVDILKSRFGETDDLIARQKISRLADELQATGYQTEFTIETPNEAAKGEQIEKQWQYKAIEGDDAALTLLSIKRLAETPDQGFYADKAAGMLNAVHADDTRIALK